MQMMEQHGHHNNALCFYSKDLPALILFIPSKHYDVYSLGIYWTFIQYPFFFFLSKLTFGHLLYGRTAVLISQHGIFQMTL